MTPRVLRRLAYFLYCNVVTYERPHSKTLEPSLIGVLIPFQNTKVLPVFNFKKQGYALTLISRPRQKMAPLAL
jgi:hypothetical protein